MPVSDVVKRILYKLRLLKWGKIEIIVRDTKVTQINTIEEDRLWTPGRQRRELEVRPLAP